MRSNPIFIGNQDLQKLSEAYIIIQEVKANITIDHKGFFAIDSIVEKLEDVINYKKFYD